MINLIQKYCEELLDREPCSTLPFHNKDHTIEVVNNIKLIAHQMGLTPEEMEPIILAGWFHDAGHSICYEGHEFKSVEIAERFLKTIDYPDDKIDEVVSCILATRMPQNPKNLPEKVICDADIMHISGIQFFYRKLLLRREWEMVLNKYFMDKEWHELNLEFLENQEFHTDYCKSILSKGVDENKQRMLRLLNSYENNELIFENLNKA